MSNEQKKCILDKEQALSLLPKGRNIHTFRNGGMAIIGADWPRADIKDAIKNNVCEIGGDDCRRMGHGLVVHIGGPLFVQTADDVDWDAEEAEALHRAELAKAGAK